MLGKRKRETAIIRRDKITTDGVPIARPVTDTVDDVFRKYFEARFDPLPASTLATSSLQEDGDDSGEEQHDGLDSEDSHESTESVWSGISEDVSHVPVVEVVDYAGTALDQNDDPVDKVSQKSFMGTRPPREVRSGTHAGDLSQPKAEEELQDKVNLKHDLELQRLLQESHLLEQTKKSSSGGIQRHKATDLRLQGLGSKASLFTQEKMPMSHRKGMLAKASSKDTNRRKEAKESGVILEKSSKKSSTSGSRRDRGVDVPVVGKFKGGTLQLSRKDVASIQGPGRGRGGRKRGRR